VRALPSAAAGGAVRAPAEDRGPMSPFLESVGLAALLGVAATFAGRLLALALSVRFLRRPGAESLVASAWLGTAFLALAYGWGSYAGYGASGCVLLIALLLAGLVAVLAVRRRLGTALRLPRAGLTGGVIVLALGAQIVVSLLSVAVGGSRLLQADNAMYFGPAEWMQGHGFGTSGPPDDASQPMVWQIQSYHIMNHRMGPMFLLALVRAAVPSRLAAELYPAVMAWGAALNMAGVFLMARWGLRVPRFYAAVGALSIAATCNSLTMSAALGFFCQVYGTATLACGLALLSRLLAPSNWRPGPAALLGLAVAAQLSMYSELSPVLVLAALAVGGFALARHRPGRLAGFAAVVLLAFVAFGNVELVRAAQGVLFMMRVNKVGWHMSWNAVHYARFAVGYFASAGCLQAGKPVLGSVDGLAGLPAGVVCLLGVAWVVRNRRALPLVAAAVVLAGLAVYFRFGAHDPWTGRLGHSWSLFKLAKWSFTVVAPLQVAGATLLARRLPRPRIAAVLVCAAVAAAAVIPHLRAAHGILHIVRRTSGDRSTLPDLRRFCRRIDALAPRRLYLASEPTDSWDRWFPAYLLCTRPFANSWKGSGLFETAGARTDQPDAFEPGTLFLQYAAPPFAEPVERLPFNYSIIDGTRPLIFLVEGHRPPPRQRDHDIWLGTEPVGLFVLCPHACDALLTVTAAAGPDAAEPAGLSLRVTDAARTTHELTVGPTATIPVKLAAGVSRLELTCLGCPTADHTTEPVRLLKITGARIDIVGLSGE